MPKFLWIADAIKKQCKTPVHITCLGENIVLPDRWFSYFLGSPLFYGVRYLASIAPFEGKFLCDEYTVGSRYAAQQLEKAGCPSGKIRVALPALPPAIDNLSTHGNTQGDITSSPTFLYVGHFLSNKGLRTLLQAFSRIRGMDAKLVLAWSGLGNLKMVEQDIASLELKNSVEIRHKKIDRIHEFRQCHALVLPYLTSFGQVSPPLLMLEAFKIGVPVIISKLPSLEETARNCALLCTPDDPVDLANHMRSLLTDKNLRTRLLDNQKKFVWQGSTHE